MRASLVCLAATMALTPATATSQTPAPLAPILADMLGTWDVSSRSWDAPGAKPVQHPSATASRSVPDGGGFVNEILRSNDPSQPYTRMATINYNAPEQKFEYASMDTRAPQLMHYETAGRAAASTELLAFVGNRFVAAQLGPTKRPTLGYRVELSAVRSGRQTLKIFFKPMKPASAEFLFMQYDYVKRGG